MRNGALVQLLATALALFSVPAVAATQIVVGGELTGATGVDVEGTLYNVSFEDGTCADEFGGCDELTDFAFTTDTDAAAAASALLGQVFVGTFDDYPYLTNGCDDPIICTAVVPYGFNRLSFGEVDTDAAFNTADGFFVPDLVLSSYNLQSEDFSSIGYGSWVWAVFTPAAPGVPEPSTWAMMLVGFGGVGFAVRRKRRVLQTA